MDLQERLIIAFCREAHVSMWVCDADFRIVLWNRGAEETYGRSADSVLDKRYDELFIDEAERARSLEDCQAIIKDGTRFRNFLALDFDAHGKQRQMLTNCFRITDSETGQHYQAEVAIDIAELEVAQTELRTLRELGLRQMIERKQTLKIRQEHLLARVADIEDIVITRARELTEEIEEALQAVSRRLRAQTQERYTQRKEAVAHERDEILRSLGSFAQGVEMAGSVDELSAIAKELGDVDAWSARIDLAATARA